VPEFALDNQMVSQELHIYIGLVNRTRFQEPQKTRYMGGNPDIWEGLCGSHKKWTVLVENRIIWFRHAYKVSWLDSVVHCRNTNRYVVPHIL
jgi:hypothetical protein